VNIFLKKFHVFPLLGSFYNERHIRTNYQPRYIPTYPLVPKIFVEPILICNRGSQTIWQKSKNRPDNCQFFIGSFMKTVNYLKVLPNLKFLK